jgi:hypothetical protein
MRRIRIDDAKSWIVTHEQAALVQLANTCQHRGDQIREMTSDICGTRGHAIPVYACELHGECTHRQACKGQDASVRICLGCGDGPWAAE